MCVCVDNVIQCKGYDVNTSNKCGDTALMYAAEKHKLEIIQILLKRQECDVRKKNDKGETAAHMLFQRLDCYLIRRRMKNEKKSAWKTNLD